MKKLTYILIFFFTFLLLPFYIIAQTPTEQWVARYNSPHSVNDRFKDMAVDKYGNSYLTGWNTDSTTGNDIITVKVNNSGQIIWSRVYNSGGAGSNDIGQAIAIDDSGNVYVAGYTGLNFGPYDYITIKYDSNGNTKWEKIYNSGSSDIPNAIAADKTGNIYITGGGSNRTITIKYNMFGDSVWVRKYLDGSNNIGLGIALDGFNNIYIAGTILITYYNYYVMKYDSNGFVQWVNASNLGGSHSVSDLFVDSLGSGAITGGYSLPTGYSDYYVIKFTSDGNTLWQKTYNGPGNFADYGTSVKCDNSGNTYVTGSSWGDDMDYFTIKYNLQGDTLWTRRYNGTANSVDNAYSIALDSVGNCYVTGSSVGLGSGDDCITIKYSPLGTQLWIVRYNGIANSDDGAGSVFINNNFVYVGGESVGIGTGKDLFVIKYNQPIGILTNTNEMPVKFYLYQNYPNPFNSQTVISYQLPMESFVNLSLFNALGQLVRVIFSGNEQAGYYSEVVNSDNLSSGIYFYRITAQSYGQMSKTFFETRKIIIIK